MSSHRDLAGERPDDRRRDCYTGGDEHGAALVMVLVMVVLLAAITMTLAEYATLGARRSTGAHRNLAAVVETETVANWYIEELTYQRDTTCTSSPSTNHRTVAVPAGLIAPTAVATLTCKSAGEIDGYPLVDVHVEVVHEGQQGTIDVETQVSTFEKRLVILTWTAS